VADRFQWAVQRTLVMGILNVTPDSFSDGGKFIDPVEAVAQARAMIAAGADIIDIGGESTRPGAQPVTEAEEIRRVVPVIVGILAAESTPSPSKEGSSDSAPLQRRGWGWIPISIDTTKATVAEAALAVGTRIVNDVSALRSDERMADVVRDSGAGVVLMHRQGEPGTMQVNPRYGDVVREVREFLAERIEFAVAAGIGREQIAIDPGIGFGKTVEHNLELLARLGEFTTLGCPVLVGASRKSFLGKVTGRESGERLAGSLAAAALAIVRGARVVRVHDVAETRDVVRLVESVQTWTR
jgi:dihydropteroate synthase